MITGHSSPQANKFFSNLRSKQFRRSQVPSLYEIHSICGLSNDDMDKIPSTDEATQEGFIERDADEEVARESRKAPEGMRQSWESRSRRALSAHGSRTGGKTASRSFRGSGVATSRSIPFKSLIPVEETLGKRNFEKIRKKYTIVDNSQSPRNLRHPSSASYSRKRYQPDTAISTDNTSYRMISPRRMALLERQVMHSVTSPDTRSMVVQEIDTHGRRMTPRIKNKPKKKIEERIARFRGSFFCGEPRKKYQGEPQMFSVDVGNKSTVMRIQVDGEIAEDLYISEERQFQNGQLGYQAIREGTFLACVSVPGTYYINKCQGLYYFCVTGSRRRELRQDVSASQFTLKITIGVDSVPPFQDLCHISHLIGFASSYSIAHERKLSAILATLPLEHVQMRDARGDTLMHVACGEVAARSVVLLLRHGIDRQFINFPNAHGDTPLMILVKSANKSNSNLACTIIETLASVGLDVDLKNKKGQQTALHFAAQSDTDGRILYTLLKIGSNRLLRNEEGQTAAEVALLYGNTKGQVVLESRVQKLAVEYEVT